MGRVGRLAAGAVAALALGLWLTACVSTRDGVTHVVKPGENLYRISRYYGVKTDAVVRPFIFQDREPIEFNALTEDSDEGFRREKFLYGVRARYRIAYGYWQHAIQMEFASPT